MVILSLISVILIVIGALGIRLLKNKKSYHVKLHHLMVIPAYILGMIAAVFAYGNTLDIFNFFIIGIITLSIIIGPFNLKYREDIKLFKNIHLIIGYISVIFLVLMVIGAYQ